MSKYQELKIELTFLFSQDCLTASGEPTGDGHFIDSNEVVGKNPWVGVN